MAYKRCHNCHIEKEVEDFTNELGRIMFLCNPCREKSNARARLRYEQGIAKTYAQQKEFRAKLFRKRAPNGQRRCIVCLNLKPVDDFKTEAGSSIRCKDCREWRKDYAHSRRLTDRAFRESQVEIVSRRHDEVRDACLEAYGNRCACCGETIKAFLTFDHVKDDGAQHRAEIGKGGAILRWLLRNKFPDVVQILCWNCQWGKRICGICPHQKAKLE